MASNAELHLIEQFLKLSGMKIIDYRIIEDIGIFLSLKNTKKQTICPRCGKSTEFLLHQNNFITIRDLPWGEQKEVSIDLWKSYKSIALQLMQRAEIVADRFHVMTAGDALG